HAIAVLFPEFPQSRQWIGQTRSLTRAQIDAQVQPDGVYFEQSTYYHVYALDFFLLHAILDPGIPAAYRARLAAMAEYLEAVQGPSRTLPFLGDDDGGR